MFFWSEGIIVLKFYPSKPVGLTRIPRVLGTGHNSLSVSPLGLGCMGMSESYYGPSDDACSIQTIQEAYYKEGITFFDTADIYGNGHNERLVGQAIEPFRKNIVLSTKFGLVTDPNNHQKRLVKANRDYVFSACEASLERLRTSYIDLYYLHRLDPLTPIEETVSAMAELVSQGKVRHIGLSEVDSDTIRRAHQIHPITAIQIEFSLFTQGPAASVLPLCKELGIGCVAYSPLGRGFLTANPLDSSTFDQADKRRTMPRFFEENFSNNMEIVSQLRQVAEGKKITLAQLALSWLLHQNENIVPIFGSKSIARVQENIQSIDVQLTSDEIKRITDIMNQEQIKGARYSAEGMQRVMGIK